jgi:cytochrome c
MNLKLVVLFFIGSFAISCKQEKSRILVFSKTAGYRHASIPDGKKALMELGKKNGIEVDTTEDASKFNEDNLKQYNAIVFLSTTLDVLDPVQQADFKRFIEAGGGFVGIHAAADTEYEWPWYGKLVGAYFKSHPKTQEAKFIKNQDFGKTNLPDVWLRTDELYNYKNIDSSVNVILKLDESSYEGGENGKNHPIAWYHEYEGGRAFYTGLGHTNESYTDSLFLSHVLDGINYAIGDDGKPDYSKAKSKRMPEENRFSKVVLDFNLNEPTEMAVLPDGNILFAERRGTLKYYDQKKEKTEIIASIPVSTKYNQNRKGEPIEEEGEDGLLGLALDPSFSDNHWIYMYYSPAGSDPKNILTRYTLNGTKLDESSRKVLIEIPVQRDQCCHTGGSIAFDAKGNLYLSTGDNTSPFESAGYSPIDEQSGRSPFDAQKSSANTNDLRGKILRIHPEQDGTYTIPEGNLFPKGEDKTRPEIYVMGNRNPYRISIDQKTGYLYWGEVGPDAGDNDSIRGPRGYDEVNQAQKAGFFGWPYFVGNNYSYAKYDFAEKKAGPKWNSIRPVNTSTNNTGKEELPSVAPAFIWYPYDKSDDFPMVKTGGRNAMAGPVYYSENYKNVNTAFPDYFDGKLLIYDWMRNWMFLVTMNEQGAIKDIESFMPNTKFNNIIDMNYGPDGKLYMIEYGTQWFKQNLDARLVRIDYNSGNRPPVAKLSADKLNGSVPLTVSFDSKGSIDPDGDKTKLELTADGKTYASEKGVFSVTFAKPGVYNTVFKITDDKGGSSEAKIQIIAGNETPVLTAQITGGNKTFFFPGSPVKYAVKVTDKEDGSSADGTIAKEAVTVSFDFLKGYDMTGIIRGHQSPSAELPGKSLMDKSDCKSCHLTDQRSAGPGYNEISQKYKGQPGAVDQLAAKIIKGGAGVWGSTEMAAHPQISVDDAMKIVDYILTLGEQKPKSKMALAGSATPGKEEDGAYLLTYSYKDKGAENLPSLTASGATVLRAPILKADQATELKTASVLYYNGNASLQNVKHNASAVYKDIDMTGIKKLSVFAYIMPGQQAGGNVELHLGSLDGKLIAKGILSGSGAANAEVKIQPVSGTQNIYVVFTNPSAGDKDLFYFGGIKVFNK